MEILGIGWMEVFFILILVLLVAGPKDIEKGARSFGRFLNRLYRSPNYQAVRRASQELRNLPARLAREAQLEELKELKEVSRDLQEAANTLNDLARAKLEVTTGKITTANPPAGSSAPATTPRQPPVPAPKAAAQADSAFTAWVQDLGTGTPPANSSPASPNPDQPREADATAAGPDKPPAQP